MMDATFNPGKSQLEELHPGNFTCVSLGSGHNIVWGDIYDADSGCNSTCNDTVSMHNPVCDSSLPREERDHGCWHNGMLDARRMDLLKCFQPDEKSGLVYATLVAATIVTLLLTVFLTFTNASKPNKQAQLEKKQVMRPKVMTAGYFLIFLSSKVGLASLTIAATTGAQYLLLTEQVNGVVVGDLGSFLSVLPILFALAMAGMLTNEFARLTEDPEQQYSAARSADGIRALADPIIVLSSPALYFIWAANFGEQTPGLGLQIASYGAFGVMLGAILMVAGAGTGFHQA